MKINDFIRMRVGDCFTEGNDSVFLIIGRSNEDESFDAMVVDNSQKVQFLSVDWSAAEKFSSRSGARLLPGRLGPCLIRGFRALAISEERNRGLAGEKKG